MQVMKWSALALAIAAVAQPVWAEEDPVQTELLQTMLCYSCQFSSVYTGVNGARGYATPHNCCPGSSLWW